MAQHKPRCALKESREAWSRTVYSAHPPPSEYLRLVQFKMLSTPLAPHWTLWSTAPPATPSIKPSSSCVGPPPCSPDTHSRLRAFPLSTSSRGQHQPDSASRWEPWGAGGVAPPNFTQHPDSGQMHPVPGQSQDHWLHLVTHIST